MTFVFICRAAMILIDFLFLKKRLYNFISKLIFQVFLELVPFVVVIVVLLRYKAPAADDTPSSPPSQRRIQNERSHLLRDSTNM
jgi:hypothetical protein